VADFLFYFLSAAAVLAGLGVILSRRPVVNVLSLLAAFMCMAVIYLLAGFQIIAATQILVYVGAIMVLFLFVVMLLNLGDPEAAAMHEPMFQTGSYSAARSIPGGLVAAGLLAVVTLAVLASDLPAPAPEPGQVGIDSATGLASWMFGRYVLPFEAVSVLLLATAVGVLVLAKRQRPGMKEIGSRTEPLSSETGGGA
jgi:NADH-quinone oxidoreductase subunit J